MNKGFAVAIDGPVASGKGTISLELAKKLDGFFFNTGAMYRATALLCLRRNIDLNSESEVAKILEDINVEFEEEKILLNGEDVSEELKKPEIAEKSSIVASYSEVRKNLAEKQRAIAKKAINEGRIVIAEGRDIGTTVLPDADIKIFLTASQEVRAKRRFQQYQEKGEEIKLEEIRKDTKVRDERDQTRQTDPLPSNPSDLGYFVLDNTNQSEEETVEAIIDEIRKRGLING